jgi:polysaccharide transporter, PST family
LVVNVLSLYSVQGFTYLLPLLTIPYLGRVLGPGGWGAVIFAQAIGALIAMAVEYGFDFSATREVARYSDDRTHLRDLVTGVLTAKAVLALIGVLLALVVRNFTVRVTGSSVLYWSGVWWGVAQGINMLWYFQGLQRMAWAAGLDASGKFVGTICIFVFVRSPADGWKVLLAQAIGCAISHGITVAMAASEVGLGRPNLALTKRVLHLGWPMFLFRASISLVGSANGLVLGFFSSAAAVGLLGSVDKLRQAALQALWPINQALFPQQSERVKDNPAAGVATVRRSLLFLGGLSLLFGLVLILGAPLLVKFFLGPAFEPAVPILRIFGLLVPVQALCTVVSTQWMLPLGLDRQVSLVVLTTGVLNVSLGIVLSIKAGAFGMAIAVTVAQVYSLFAFWFTLHRRRIDPLRFPVDVEPIEPVMTVDA